MRRTNSFLPERYEKIHTFHSDFVYSDLNSFNLVNRSNFIHVFLKKYLDYLEENIISKDEIKRQKHTKQREICMTPSQIEKYIKNSQKSCSSRVYRN